MKFRKLFGYPGGQKRLLPHLMKLLPDHEDYIEVFGGGACYSEDTEVLTSGGWKLFQNVKDNELICTRNKDGFIEYEYPSDIILKEYQGPMYRLRTSKSVDLLVTPAHNLYVAFAKGAHKFPTFNLSKARDVFGGEHRHVCDAKWDGEDPEFFILPPVRRWSDRTFVLPPLKLPMGPFLDFFGWYIAEGYCRHNSSYVIHISQKNAKNRIEIAGIIKNMGFKKVKVTTRGVKFSSKQMYLFLHPLGRSYEKFIPREILKLSSKLLRLLMDSYLKGNGSDNRRCWTSSKHLRDDLQEVALKIGWRGIYRLEGKAGDVINFGNGTREFKHDNWEISFAKRNLRPIINSQTRRAKGFIERFEDYNGLIGCVEVPNHVIYVRRNGRPIWCGNTLLLNKDLSKFEVFNDLNKNIVTLFRVVKDDFDAFAKEVEFFLQSRQMFKEFKQGIDEVDDVKKAAMFYFMLRTSFDGKAEHFSVKKHGHSVKSRPFKLVEEIKKIHNRLKNVVFESMDFEKLIKKYDDEDAFFFCDPPYYEITGLYQCDFTRDDHIRFFKALKDVQAKFLVTYGDHDFIRMLWRKFVQVPVVTQGSMGTQKKRKKVPHILIANYDIKDLHFKPFQATYFRF